MEEPVVGGNLFRVPFSFRDHFESPLTVFPFQESGDEMWAMFPVAWENVLHPSFCNTNSELESQALQPRGTQGTGSTTWATSAHLFS